MAGWTVEDDAAPAKAGGWSVEDDAPPASSSWVPQWLLDANERAKSATRKFSSDTDELRKDPAKTVGSAVVAAGQGVTFNFADEIEAAIRAGLDSGLDYDTALAQAREKVAIAQEQLGDGYDAINMTAGLVVPGVNGVRLAQRVAGPGANAAARTGGVMAAGGAMGTAGALGAQEEKDVSDALLYGGGAGVATAGLLYGGGSAVAKVSDYGADAIDRARQVVAKHRATRTGTPFVPSERTQDWATREIVDQLASNGIRTPAQLNAQMARSSIPDTPQAIAGINDGQVSGDVVMNASKIKDPNALGYNPVERYADTQLRNSAGVPQADALVRRVEDQVGLTPAQRDPARMTAEIADQREVLGQRLGDIRNRGGNTNAPGFAQRIDENPEALAIWREVQKQNVRGSPDFIEPELIPLPQGQYDRAYAAWEAREQAAAAAGLPFAEPPPILLTDRNVPIALYANFQREASQRANDGSEAARRLYALNDTEALANPGRRTGAVSVVNRRISDLHNQKTDIDAGRRILGQDDIPRSDAQAAFRGMPQGGPRRTSMSVGVVHGFKDVAQANADDLSKVAEVFENSAVREAWDEVVGSIHSGNPRAAGIREQAERVGRSQEFVALARKAQRARTPEEKRAAEVALKVYIRMQFTPAAGYASVLRDVVDGRDQTRRLATLDQALDTSRGPQSGYGRVTAEMQRIIDARGLQMDGRTAALINLLSREAGTTAGDNK